MRYEVKMKRDGEDPMTIVVGPNGFRADAPIHIKIPGKLIGAINAMVSSMSKENFEEVEIKKVS